MLHSVICDVLLRFNISKNKLRGQCYDGAASMSGAQTGVAKRISDEEPRAVYTHCYGHALNLAVADSVKACKCMRNALDGAYEIVKLVKKSPTRDAILQNLKQKMPEDSPGIRALCPTRWTVRAKSLESILQNYQILRELWEVSLDIVKETEMRSRIQGISVYMNSFDFFYGLVLAELLLSHSDNLSKTLQSSSMSAAEGQRIAEMTVHTLQKIRDNESFDLFWQRVLLLVKENGVNDPELPRLRKRPRKYSNMTSEEEIPVAVEDIYRPIYYEALDLVINGIKSRFDQPGYRIYSKLEDLVVKAANKENWEEEITFICDFYGEDFSKGQLRMQLGLLSSSIPDNSQSHNLCSVLQYLRELNDSQRALMSEVCSLPSLIVVMPATNACSERSFSSLRRVKSYLRSTMTQTRLNSTMMLNVHQDRTDELNLIDIGNEFIRENTHRESIFGKFQLTDLDTD